MGFAAGFAAGWGAVDSAMRQKMDADRAKKDDEYRTAQQAMQTERFGREQKAWKEQDAEDAMKRDATQPVPVGTSVGENFTANPGTAAWLAQQSADQAELSGAAPAQQSPAIGLAIGAQGKPEVQKFGTPEAANKAASFQNEPTQIQERVVEGYKKLGKTDKMLAAQEQFKRLSKEGYKEALDHGFMTGDWSGAGEQFNKIGSVKLPEGTTLLGTPFERITPGGQKVQDVRLQAVDKDGNVVREIGSAIEMRHKADGFENWQQSMSRDRTEGRQERTVGVAEKNAATQESRIALDEKKIAIQQQLADARERRDEAQMKYWAGQLDATNRRIDIAASRAAAGGGSGKADGAPATPGVDRNDEKHIAEIVGNMGLPKGTNPALIVDTAARIKALAPGISASESATIAATPGAKVRSVQTNKGVFDALEVPDREVVGKDGKKSIVLGGVYLMAPGARQIPVPRPPPAPAAPKLSAAQIAAMDAEKRAADEQAAQVAQQEAAAARAAATASFARPR